MRCPVCLDDSPHAELLRHLDPFGGREYSLRACRACGAAFSDPMENPGPLWYARTAAVWAPAEKPAVPAWRLAALRSIRSRRPELTRLLEIGCSDGAFLLEARALGFEPHGVDFDGKATAAARAAGLSGVTTAYFDDFAAVSPGGFGVIAFFQTLEHLTDPRAFLARVRGLLAPGGLILFDVPDADRPLAAGSGLIDLPPHHLTRWRRRTVLRLLADAGFEPSDLGSLATYAILRDSVGSWLAARLGALKRALSSGRAAPGAAAAGGAAPAAPSASPSAAFRAFDLAWRFALAPLLAPALLIWLAALKLSGGGFYLRCEARLRARESGGDNSI